MQDDNPGIAFHEIMLGPFALGEFDPHIGAEKGKAAGTTLSIACNIKISNVDRFISDPNHKGDIIGQISYSPFSENMSAKYGLFNLFLPTVDSMYKLMVYELGFEYDSQDYYLTGQKEVRNDPVYDLWQDTTTLYTTLHQGIDPLGPVIGAGILTIDFERFRQLISSIEVTNTLSIAEKARTLLNFGHFFLGELWDIYRPTAQSP